MIKVWSLRKNVKIENLPVQTKHPQMGYVRDEKNNSINKKSMVNIHKGDMYHPFWFIQGGHFKGC